MYATLRKFAIDLRPTPSGALSSLLSNKTSINCSIKKISDSAICKWNALAKQYSQFSKITHVRFAEQCMNIATRMCLRVIVFQLNFINSSNKLMQRRFQMECLILFNLELFEILLWNLSNNLKNQNEIILNAVRLASFRCVFHENVRISSREER